MLKFLKNIMNLNAILATKAQGAMLFTEAEAFSLAKDYKKAFPLMKQSAELGNEDALIHAGLMAMKGQGTECNWLLAAQFFECSVKQHKYPVNIHLGMLYGIGGYGLKRDHQKAEKHLQAAIDQDGDETATAMLDSLQKRKPPFGGKEITRPQVAW